MRLRSATVSLVLAAALATVGAASASAGPAAGGGQVTNGPSCAVKCITSALIEPHTGSFGISVHTDTPAQILIGISTLVAGDGEYIRFSTSAPGRTSWAHHMTGLEPDTLYKVTVTATDGQGHTERRSTFYRTRAVQTNVPEGPGDVQSNVGCSQPCVAYSHIVPEGTGVGLTIDTTVPAKLRVSVDRDAPGTIDGAPFFGTPEGSVSTTQFAKRWSGFFKDLVPGSNYHIIIRATDANGSVQYVQGIFRTKTREARLVLDGIRVYYDGDKGANRGELNFAMAVNQQSQSHLRIAEKKVASGNWVNIPHGGVVQLTPQSRGLNLAVQARERDHAASCFDRSGTDLWPSDSGHHDAWCDKWTWVTARAVIDLDTRVPGTDLPPTQGGTGRHAVEFATRWDAGIRYVVYGWVDVRYS